MNVVHCPACGAAVALPFEVGSVTKYPSQLVVIIYDQTVSHSCPKPPRDAP